uniref:Peroxin-7 n=1 Tax=Malawimonas jakobiformis TaxID=136089 RepID=A0A895KQ77_MALJA|nr:Gsp-co-occurring protein 1 [Malawimonas jakobiformis]
MDSSASVSLDFEATDLQYSPFYQSIVCVGTFDYGNWVHTGSLWLCHVDKERDEQKPSITSLATVDNGTGVQALTWSEHYVNSIMTANYDWSISFWNANKAEKVLSCAAHSAPVRDVDWNTHIHDYVLTASDSSRIKLWDLINLEHVVSQFAEHTKAVNAVRWNNNNQEQFASSSDDGLVKIWDRRSADASVTTLFDRESGSAMLCCDWHKSDDWLLAVGSANRHIYIWDTRNPLMPVMRREAHRGAVRSVRFDTTHPSRLLTGAEDGVTRAWSIHEGIFLTHEHRLHAGAVTAVDWTVHDSALMTSCGSGADASLVSVPLQAVQQVREVERDGRLVTMKLPLGDVSAAAAPTQTDVIVDG